MDKCGDWVRDARCAEVGTEMFFPRKGESAVQAQQVCFRCPVREECLTYALVENLEYGVWGGATMTERRTMHAPEGACRG